MFAIYLNHFWHRWGNSGLIRAPIAGTILTRSAEPGRVVQPGQTILTMVDLSKLYLRGFVPEGAIGKVKVGQQAQIYLDSNPKQGIPAEVIRIDPEAMFTPENTYFKEDRVKQVMGLPTLLPCYTVDDVATIKDSKRSPLLLGADTAVLKQHGVSRTVPCHIYQTLSSSSLHASVRHAELHVLRRGPRTALGVSERSVEDVVGLAAERLHQQAQVGVASGTLVVRHEVSSKQRMLRANLVIHFGQALILGIAGRRGVGNSAARVGWSGEILLQI
jgi:hypothetical protein